MFISIRVIENGYLVEVTPEQNEDTFKYTPPKVFYAQSPEDVIETLEDNL